MLSPIVRTKFGVRNGSTNIYPKLATSFPAFVVVKSIITPISSDCVFKIYGATEELDTVVGVSKNFDVVELRTSAHAS